MCCFLSLILVAELHHISSKPIRNYSHITGISHASHWKMLVTSINGIIFQIILVQFFPPDIWHSCTLHPLGCGKTLVFERPSHGVGSSFAWGWLTEFISQDIKFRLMSPIAAACAFLPGSMLWELVVSCSIELLYGCSRWCYQTTRVQARGPFPTKIAVMPLQSFMILVQFKYSLDCLWLLRLWVGTLIWF